MCLKLSSYKFDGHNLLSLAVHAAKTLLTDMVPGMQAAPIVAVRDIRQRATVQFCVIDVWRYISQARDTGVYECQVNTEPKRSLAFFLRVVGEFTSFRRLHARIICCFGDLTS